MNLRLFLGLGFVLEVFLSFIIIWYICRRHPLDTSLHGQTAALHFHFLRAQHFALLALGSTTESSPVDTCFLEMAGDFWGTGLWGATLVGALLVESLSIAVLRQGFLVSDITWGKEMRQASFSTIIQNKQTFKHSHNCTRLLFFVVSMP